MAIRSRRKRASTAEIAAAVLQPRLVDVLPLLRCPRTGDELKPTDDGSLIARSAGWRYPVFDGVPVLIDLEHSLLDVTAPPPVHVERAPNTGPPGSGLRGLVESARRRLPMAEENAAGRRNHRRLVDLLRVRSVSGRHPRVLVIGGQPAPPGVAELLECPELQVIETGSAVGARTDVVCDPHYLPFADRTFDAVVIEGVLDSVVEPRRVAAEVHRVLGEAGLVYSEAGFMRQVYAGPLDFNRFTHLGHRRLWRFFDEVDSGAHRGPGLALMWSTEYFLRAFAGNSRVLAALVGRAVALFGFWLKWLDGFLARRPGGIDAAAGTYFLGTRRDAPVPEHELVAAFRGVRPKGRPVPEAHTERAGVPGDTSDAEIRVSRGIRAGRGEESPDL